MIPPDDDMPVIPTARHDNPEMLTEKNNDEKLAITLLIAEAGLIASHFWQKISGINVSSQSVVPW